MSKIRIRFMSILVSFLTLPSIALAQAELWPAGENICEGGWQYEQLQSCELTGTIVNGDVSTGTCEKLVEDFKVYTSCRAKTTDAVLGCGPETYANCQSMSCPGSVSGLSYSITRKNGTCDLDFISCKKQEDEITSCFQSGRDAIIRCKEPDRPATCRDSSCSIETWKSCRHSSCPVEKTHYKCERWSSGYSDACGKIEQKVTSPGTLKPDNVATDARRVKDYYAIGSECLTCDDIPLDTAEYVRKRFECLAKGISLAEAQKPGYSFAITFKILGQLQYLGFNYSSYLTRAQATRLQEILSKYSLGG